MKHHILIVDDYQDLRESLGLFLRMSGYEVSEAKNGKEALSLIDEHHFDIVITDLNMPLMSGLELLAKLSTR